MYLTKPEIKDNSWGKTHYSVLKAEAVYGTLAYYDVFVSKVEDSSDINYLSLPYCLVTALF